MEWVLLKVTHSLLLANNKTSENAQYILMTQYHALSMHQLKHNTFWWLVTMHYACTSLSTMHFDNLVPCTNQPCTSLGTAHFDDLVPCISHTPVYYSSSFWTIYMTSNRSYIIKVYHTSKQDNLKVQVYHTSKQANLKSASHIYTWSWIELRRYGIKMRCFTSAANAPKLEIKINISCDTLLSKVINVSKMNKFGTNCLWWLKLISAATQYYQNKWVIFFLNQHYLDIILFLNLN